MPSELIERVSVSWENEAAGTGATNTRRRPDPPIRPNRKGAAMHAISARFAFTLSHAVHVGGV